MKRNLWRKHGIIGLIRSIDKSSFFLFATIHCPPYRSKAKDNLALVSGDWLLVLNVAEIRTDTLSLELVGCHCVYLLCPPVEKDLTNNSAVHLCTTEDKYMKSKIPLSNYLIPFFIQQITNQWQIVHCKLRKSHHLVCNKMVDNIFRKYVKKKKNNNFKIHWIGIVNEFRKAEGQNPHLF